MLLSSVRPFFSFVELEYLELYSLPDELRASFCNNKRKQSQVIFSSFDVLDIIQKKLS